MQSTFINTTTSEIFPEKNSEAVIQTRSNKVQNQSAMVPLNFLKLLRDCISLESYVYREGGHSNRVI